MILVRSKTRLLFCFTKAALGTHIYLLLKGCLSATPSLVMDNLTETTVDYLTCKEGRGQGTLTEGEGSVRFTPSLRLAVL